MLVSLLSLTSLGWAESKREISDQRLDHAGKLLRDIMAVPDRGIPGEIIEHAKCVAVVLAGLVMIIQNDRGMHRFLSSKFEIGADASAAAGPVGRRASLDTGWKLNTEILTYSRAKGAFAGLTLNGASLRRDNDSMGAVYGRHVSTRRVLQGEVAAPLAAQSFLTAVRDAKSQAKTQDAR